jgi:nucleoside-diphosphate-sugar epimerase
VKVTVTGGLGKLGQHVVKALVDTSRGREAHRVTVLDRALGPERPGVHYLVGNVEDLGNVMGALAGADAVIHLAAIPHPVNTPNEVTFRVNVMGTFNVHEAAWRLGIRRVVSTSSTAALGWDFRERDFLPAYLPIDEDHPVRPQDPYGLSKEVGEAIARSYTARCDMETVALRPPWIVSPEELEGLRRSNGREVVNFRHFSYIDVRDLAEAYRLAVERPLPGHTVMWVAADDSAVAEPLCELLPRLVPAIGDMAHDLTGTRPAISNTRARELLGWQPTRTWRRPDPDSA